MRERKDVYNLPPNDDTLDWYDKAVGRMKSLPITDQLSWAYQAAVHGTVTPLTAATTGFWAECQHASSFFLPWHRMYVLHFERIVAKHIEDLNGPVDWALPYWNYTTSDPRTLSLPPRFRNPWNADGTPNNLYEVQRAGTANSGAAILGSRDVALTCLRAPGTTAPVGFFGGVPSAHFGSLTGALELTPHNNIHNRVGGSSGYMADPDFAALDPIFWLHHSNIDRLWEVWLDCDPSHRNLTSAYWLTGISFQFHNAMGVVVTMNSVDVLILTAPLLDYKYTDSVCPVPFKTPSPPPMAAVPIGPIGPGPGGPSAPVPTGGGATMPLSQPDLVGATHSAVRLGNQTQDVTVPTPITPRAFRQATSNITFPLTARARQMVQRVTLHLEQVLSTNTAPTYDVFLNLPDGADPNQHEDRFVARVSMFGIKQASDPNGRHGGGGQNFAFDITELYHRLDDLNQIDPANLKVTFVPVDPVSDQQVTVGRVSLYFA
jgi:tyrosinase